MTSRERGWLLPPASLALVAGVFLGRITAGLLWPLIACATALPAVFCLKGRKRLVACVALSLAIGTAAGSAAFHPVLPEEGDYEIRGVISDEITSGSFGQRRIWLADLQLNERPFSGKAYWTFYADELPEGLSPGREVSFRASLYHPNGADNPDGFDFREYLLQRGVTICLYGRENLQTRDPDAFSLAGAIASLRHRLSVSLRTTLGEETGAYASALLLGMRGLIPSEDREAFSRLGIAHILSVSGFHVGLLIGALSALFHLLRLRPSVRLVLYAVILLFYAALCSMSQPVIRASLLLLLHTEGRILNRPRSGIHQLCGALFFMTLLSPVQVTSASYQLTFCAVAGILWFAQMARTHNPFRRALPHRLYRDALMLFGAQLGLLFPELLFFQRLPLLVYLINLPAMLLASALIGLFWLVVLLLPLPGVASLLSGPLAAVTGWLLSGVRRLGSLPGLTLWIHSPNALTALGIILLFLAFCCFVRFRKRIRLAFLCLGAAALTVSLLPAHHAATEYIQLSAGNADAAVLWDQDRVYVMDTGEADGVLSEFLRARRLTPDAVILTHLHTDHAGGLKSMMEDEIPIPLILIPEGAEAQDIHPDFPALLSELSASGTEIRTLSRGTVIPLPSGTLTVLWPEEGKVRPMQDANQYSLVCRLNLKGTSLLQAGDLTGSYEHYAAAPADILKAAHHGSPSSSFPDFLDAVSPRVILLSCQRLSRLSDFRERAGGRQVYGTAESGALTVRFEENGFTVIPHITP